MLGTVQFGLLYGVANKTGQPDQARVTEIIRTAWENGIREFDTAQDYGGSEKMLGTAFSQLSISHEAQVISKINPELNHCDPQIMSEALNRSLERLGVSSLYGLMLHKEDLLSQLPNGLGEILHSFVKSGKIKKVGVSVYSPKRALEALLINGFDMVQLPANILDSRFEKQRVFELAEKAGRQIYIRSVFLQGLILMDPNELSGQMSFAKPVLEKIKSLAQQLNVTKHELALGYLKERFPTAKLVIGVETPEQLEENLGSWGRKPARNLLPLVSQYFDQVDEKILNPTLWMR